ncbi:MULTISPECIES: helix-turn-helix domain-containing protein [Bacillus cereus group]|uniref:helix-turn-helix domain-containing protein n=1 Tax=Bacillus cereus group TaxID=86661 RepID=UPI0008727AC9|nr:helix-turn-helix transcriptional regulator [Bacillus mycoides]MBJ8071074.1 helix-turn-helix transcriptional regulator [Bacillus cereus]MBJ8188309.1 helix-turn-helix transcriptional regulator [Bacillus cereus]OFD42451.1 transcriptional regulator [Bacillus mycoides]OFD45920.1 transcriptional regulator [Bacillus mycoides]
MEIGERIRQVRMHKGLTQGELVSEICSVTYLSRIESGKIKPSSSFLKKVSKKLDVDGDYLIEGNHEEIKLTILEICNKYKKDKSITEAELSSLELYVREVDSIPLLLKVYGVLIYYHARQKNLLYVKSFVDQALEMIPSRVEMQYTEDYIYYLRARGLYFSNKGEYFTAYGVYKKIENMLESEETELHADTYYNISIVSQNLNKDQSVSRIYAKKAYELYKKFDIEQHKIYALILLAMQYNKDKQYEQAFETLKQVENESKVENDSLNLCYVKYNYGKIYQALKDYKNAIKCYEENLVLCEYLPNKAGKVYTIRNLIEIYIELKDWQTVTKLIYEAFEILSICDVPYVHVQLYGFKAEKFKIRADYNGYEKHMKQAIEMGIEKQQYSLVAELAYKFGDYYYENRSYKLSAKYYKISAENKMD